MDKSSYVLGSELWESKFDGLLSLVKEYIIDVWEIRKHKLYDSDSGLGQQLHSRSSPGERNGKFSQNGKFGQNGKLGHSCTNLTKGKLYGSRVSDHAIVHLGLNVSSSTHNCGCVVDGGNAMATEAARLVGFKSHLLGVHMNVLPSHVKPEVNCVQLAVEDGSTSVGGWLQLTRKDCSALVRGLPQAAG